ncbi:hypothetical protein ACGF12_19575 [Kitasatospora sp. NPDC048296]|uniref:hypothetical protein n=1 Tax=Kitasatospora sp. NPDC048296 TaxID=3364048 RepID=UPI00371AC0A0
MTRTRDARPGDPPSSGADEADALVERLLDREERRLLSAAAQREDSDNWFGLVADAGFVRRCTVLARAAPLHRIDQRQAWQQFPDDLYDPRALALAALEAVVSRQGMELEATTEEVVEYLASLAQAAAPESSAEEHVAVARFVVRELLNDHGGGAEFSIPYSDYRQGHSRGELSFRFLEEAFGRHGQAVLKASASAVNLLLVGLDHDLEDQQAANDAMLRRQVSTGRWGRAEESAAQSLKLSLLYAEQVRSLLAETERDVRSVDWDVRVPALLGSSRAHLMERQAVECDLMEWMRQARNDVDDAEVRRTCVRILHLLERAHLRHTQLLERVIGARPAFLRAQSDQCFKPVPRLSVIGLQEDLLDPLLELGAEQAEQVAALFADACGGPIVTRKPRLRDFWELLLAPVRETRESFPDDPVDLITDEDEDSLGYAAQDFAAARRLLEQALQGPVRLSVLLAQAEKSDPAVADILALCVLRAFAPDAEEDEVCSTDLADLLEERLVVLADGSTFDLGFMTGTDLLLVPAAPLIPDPVNPDSTPTAEEATT